VRNQGKATTNQLTGRVRRLLWCVDGAATAALELHNSDSSCTSVTTSSRCVLKWIVLEPVIFLIFLFVIL
jgi:hypothetical protein